MTTIPGIEPVSSSTARCPIDHSALSYQKTAHIAKHTTSGPQLERGSDGTWHVRGFAEARAILRGDNTKQAGFRAELLERISHRMEMPILYQEGQVHHEQRRQTQRFFTPKFIGENYREMMENFADAVIGKLRSQGGGELSTLSRAMAVKVTCQVVGLTTSLWPGVEKRIDAFFEAGQPAAGQRESIGQQIMNRINMLAFYLIDVLPAIRARRKQPGDDVISHLIGKGYNNASILTECVTYGAAGMVTTREFISVATWHFLSNPALRQRYLVAGETERLAMLHEILRLEPVVGQIMRRATEDFTVESQGQQYTIAKGDLISIDIYETNADSAIVGEDPRALCPARPLGDPKAGAMMLSFGDGHHRCPGAFLAMQESDIFLQRLLAIDTLHIANGPALQYGAVAKSYELRNFQLEV